MSDPDRIDEEALPDLPVESLLAIADVDLAIEEVLRELDECDIVWDQEVDRTLVIHLLRMAYIHGYLNCRRDLLIS